MSGYMVALEHGRTRDIYMVREKHPVLACDFVRNTMKKGVAHALAPVSDETLDHFKIMPQSFWHMNRHDCEQVICCQEMHDGHHADA